MNRRAVVIGGLALGASAFAGGAWYVTRQRETARVASLQAAASRAQPDTLIRPHSPILGPRDAPVTLAEFFDPSCEACRAFHPAVSRLLRDYPEQLRVVLRYTPFHQGSDEAVRILEFARRQDLFEPVLNTLLEYQPAWAVHGNPRLDLAWQMAGQAGLDLERAQTDRLHPDITGILNQDMADVEAMQIPGTPTFYINGQPVTDLSIENLRSAVAAAVDAL